MIRIKYECDETGQEMNITVDGVGSDKADVSIKFLPEISDGTEDPYGVMGRVFSAITTGD